MTKSHKRQCVSLWFNDLKKCHFMYHTEHRQASFKQLLINFCSSMFTSETFTACCNSPPESILHLSKTSNKWWRKCSSLFMWYPPCPSISDMFQSRLSLNYMFIRLVLRWSPTVHLSGSQGVETESSTSQALGVGRQDLKQDKRRCQRITDWIQEPYLYIQDNQYSWNTFPVTFLTGDSVPSI